MTREEEIRIDELERALDQALADNFNLKRSLKLVRECERENLLELRDLEIFQRKIQSIVDRFKENCFTDPGKFMDEVRHALPKERI